MAKTNYPEELVALVEEYLTDGIITDKERRVLLNKAQQLGVDVDEFDLYIDAQQQKVDQAVDAAASKKRGKTCPFCGGTVPQLTDKCPHCNETITPEASAELQEIFNNLEEALVDLKSEKNINRSKATVERYVRKAKMYYENNPKVQKILADIEAEKENSAKKARRKSLIKFGIEKLKNPWSWLVLEIIGFCLIYVFFHGMQQFSDSRWESACNRERELLHKYEFANNDRFASQYIGDNFIQTNIIRDTIDWKEHHDGKLSQNDLERSEMLKTVTNEDWEEYTKIQHDITEFSYDELHWGCKIEDFTYIAIIVFTLTIGLIAWIVWRKSKNN